MQPAVPPPTGGRQTERRFLRDLAEACRLPEPETDIERGIADSGMDARTFQYTARWAAGITGKELENDLVQLAGLTARAKGRGRILAEGPLRAAVTNGRDELQCGLPARRLIGLYRETPPTGSAAATPFSAPKKRSAYYRGQSGTVPHLDLSFRLLDCLGDRSCAGICPATGHLDLERTAELIRINTGDVFKPRSLLTVAYLIYALERLYNIREAKCARRDGHAKFALEVPGGLEMSPEAWENIDLKTFRQVVARHYRQTGWDRKTLVKKKILERLGIAELWNQFKLK